MKENKGKFLKKTLKYVITYIFFIVLFLILLTVTSLIPRNVIKEKTTESANILFKEGNRKLTYIPYKDVIMQFDNYSDALMINTAYSIDTENPLYSAMVARKNYIPNITQSVEQDSVTELKSASKYKYHDEVSELKDVVNDDITESFEYARYWHGYLVILRPLLTFANVQTIRIISIFIFIALAGVLIYFINKKINWVVSLIFLLGLIGVEYTYIGISIQSSFVFMIMMIVSLIILIRGDRIKDIPIIFFVTGILTNFFDLLTVPAITYGLPILIYFLQIQKTKQLKFNEMFAIFLKTGIAWAIGYALTWFTKWALVDILYDRNLILTGIQQVLYRSVGGGNFSYLLILSYNMECVKNFIVLELLLAIIYMIVNMVNKKQTTKLENVLPYFIIGIIPLVWYFIIRDHSLKHAFFTYRLLVLTLISLPIGIYYLFDKKVKKENKKEKTN